MFATGAALVMVAAGCGAAAGDRAAETTSPPIAHTSQVDASQTHDTVPDHPSEARIVRAGEAPTTYAGADLVYCVATAEQTGGSYSFLEIEIPAGSGPPTHQHDSADEWFFVLGGTASIEVGQLRDEVTAGDYFHVPRGTTHSIQAVDAVRLLAGFAPGGEESRVFTCPT